MRPWLLSAAALLVLAGCASQPTPSAAPATTSQSCTAFLAGIDLDAASITDLAQALAQGRITSVQLVQAYEARIRLLDNVTNSVQTLAPGALEQAVALDAERAAGHVRGPLHGIPILLKDNVGTTDMPTTAGSIALATNIPKSEATVTAKLRDAGAIVLGKTKMSEFAQWISLNNPNGYSSLGGQVHNAYTGGDPSGSSSGSGVAAAMAYAAAAIGSETQGSILGPSDANSLVGVKTTVGLVSRAGIIPLAPSFDTPGPMARDVRSAALVLDAIAGADARDPATSGAGGHVPAGGYAATLSPDGLQGVRLGYDPRQSGTLWDAARKELQNAGATLVPVDMASQADQAGTSELGLIPNEFKASINAYLANEAGPGLPVSDLTGIILYNDQHQDRVKYGQDLLLASDATPGDTTAAPLQALAARTAAQAFWTGILQQNSLDAFVGPGLSYYQTGAEAGMPTVIVPMGYSDHSPQGLSFLGPAWSEPRLLGYAYAYEQHTHHRIAPLTQNPQRYASACASAPN